MTKEELKKVLELHKKWLNNETDGVRANLWGTDLRGIDLRGVNLRLALLSEADMRGTDLREANFRGADMCRVDISGTDCRGADLSGTDLRGSDMRKTDLSGADLWMSKLWGTRLQGAKLSEVINLPFIPYACPEKGEFVAFKKCGEYIIELLIPADAKRCSATTRECRASYAKVLSITTISGKSAKTTSVINTNYLPNVIYEVGKFVYPDSFDNNRWNEFSHGIHFFINRQEAVEYQEGKTMCTGMTSFNQPDGWISVKDRLPDTDREVLVYDLHLGCFVLSCRGMEWADLPVFDLHVTHWRELPDPPRMEGENED